MTNDKIIRHMADTIRAAGFGALASEYEAAASGFGRPATPGRIVRFVAAALERDPKFGPVLAGRFRLLAARVAGLEG